MSEIPTYHVHLPARLVVYSMGVLMIASMAIAVVFGAFAYSAMAEVASFREAAYQAQHNSRTCNTSLQRADAKLEMVNGLFAYSRTGKRPVNGQGGGN